jgi:3-oxoacyl-[acyl-carrier-protein] synthase II
MKRVAITGYGMVTSLGLDAPTTWENLVRGRSGVRKIESYDTTGEKIQCAGEVSLADAQKLHERIDPAARERTDRFVHFATAAAREALDRAGHPQKQDSERWGAISGVGFGSPQSMDGYKVNPTTIIRQMPNAAPAWIAIENGLRGPNFSVNSACASGSHAIGVAFDQIRLGKATGMVAGGVDTVISREVIRTYAWMRAVNSAQNEAPEKMSRPFDATRIGFVLGEGAAYMILEEWEHAVARGADIIAEMRGWAATCDAFNIVAIAPDGAGMISVMNNAMADAGVRHEDIAYISAHGTGTRMNDKEETVAIHRTFGDHAKRMMVSSQKSMIGHCMGGAGAIEGLVTVLSLKEQIVTPTINLDHPDPECDLDYVPNESRKVAMRFAMSNSFGFGGHNCSLIFGTV